MNIVDLYDILKVKKDATHKEIKKSYKILVLKCHPDKGGSQVDFELLTMAYSVLGNEIERATYDKLCHKEKQIDELLLMKESNKKFMEESKNKINIEDAKESFDNHMKEMNMKYKKNERKTESLQDLIDIRNKQVNGMTKKEAEDSFNEFVKKMDEKYASNMESNMEFNMESNMKSSIEFNNENAKLMNYTGDFLPWDNNDDKYGYLNLSQ